MKSNHTVFQQYLCAHVYSTQYSTKRVIQKNIYIAQKDNIENNKPEQEK